MAVTFGWEPFGFVVSLSRGGDFIFTLEASTSWPAGITIELRFSTARPDEDESPIVWPATITGSHANWDVSVDDVAKVLDGDAHYVRLRYAEADGSVLVWGKGVVNAS